MSNENLNFLVYELRSDQSTDRNQIGYLSQILADWLTYHNGEPLNLERAAFEYQQHRKEYAIQHVRDNAERQKRTQAEQNDLSETCRRLAEPHFEIIFSDKDVQRIVIWDDTICDPLTKDRIGSVRDIIQAAWVRPRLDPRDNSQRNEYLAEIRRLFDDYRTPIAHSGSPKSRWLIEKAPFKRQPDRVYAAILIMRWKQLP